MTGLAGIPECSCVWIAMTWSTIPKIEILKSGRRFRRVRLDVAFDARDFFVGTINVEACPFVIEMNRPFPVQFVMTALTLRKQFPLMGICMTTYALPGQSQIRAGFVFYRNIPHVCLGNTSRLMACPACHGFVPAFKWIAGLSMIELLDRYVPMDQIEAFSIVLDMAMGATPAGLVGSDQ